MKGNLSFIALAIGIVAIGFGIYWATSQPEPLRVIKATKPVLEVIPPAFDLGSVSVKWGEVHTTFLLKNAGNETLVLEDMDTSCGCTEAAVVIDGKEGPRFNMRMHGNPQNWSVSLAPGQEVELRVYYDPQTHPDLRGAVTREVYLFGDNLQIPLAKARIFVNQTS